MEAEAVVAAPEVAAAPMAAEVAEVVVEGAAAVGAAVTTNRTAMREPRAVV
jgi:hypothetical protein